MTKKKTKKSKSPKTPPPPPQAPLAETQEAPIQETPAPEETHVAGASTPEAPTAPVEAPPAEETPVAEASPEEAPGAEVPTEEPPEETPTELHKTIADEAPEPHPEEAPTDVNAEPAPHAQDLPTREEPIFHVDAPQHMPEDVEATVNLTGDVFNLPGRDDLDAPTQTALPESIEKGLSQATRKHLRGLVEALVFASDRPIKPSELAKTASAQAKEVRELLEELKADYAGRGVQLDEVAGGWIFRTSPIYAPFVRDLTKQKPVKLTRAQIETLAILAYRQPITRPEIDEIRGVDSGPVLKVLLERDLVRILGKKDEPGRPLLYGTTTAFLEFFGLKSVKDLPTLHEFTELNEDSRRVVERELGETLESVQTAAEEANAMADEHTPSEESRDTIAPPVPHEHGQEITEPPPASAEHEHEHEHESAEHEEADDVHGEVHEAKGEDEERAETPAEREERDAEAKSEEDEELAEGDRDEDFDDDDDDEDFDDDDDEDDDDEDDDDESEEKEGA